MDSKLTQTIMLANQKFTQTRTTELETFKLLVDKTTECVSLKDSILRNIKKEMEAALDRHQRAANENAGLLRWNQELIDSLAKTELIVFDQKRVGYAKDSVSQMLERINSYVFQNYRDIDDVIIHILFNLNTDKVDSLKNETNKIVSDIKVLNSDKIANNKREGSLQSLYEFFKRMLKSTFSLRATYRDSVLGNEADLIDTMTLLGAEPNEKSQNDPYFAKVDAVKNKIVQMMEVAIEKINASKARINSLKIMNSQIGEGGYASKEQIEKTYQEIVNEMINLDSSFYGMILMDLNLFYTLIGKSYQFMNRKMQEALHSCCASYIEAENSSLYYKLIHQGDEQIPYLIDVFLSKYKAYMAQLHQENVDKFLLPNFDEEIAEITEEEAWRTVVVKNQKTACRAVNLAVDVLNLFLEEINNGRNRNEINYNIFNRDYPQLMLRLSPKLGQMEEFKKFAANAFDPKAWTADKLRVKNLSQMVYDLAALEQDSTMSNNRKFNTMKDHVNTLRTEVAYFSSIIFSAQRSRPDIQDIVRSYTETLKGLWNRINKEIASAEQVMVQVLRNAKLDGNSQFATNVQLTPEEVKAAHRLQKQLITEIVQLVESLDPDVLLTRNAAVVNQVNIYSQRHKALLNDKKNSSCFSRLVAGCETEFNFNQQIFQDMAGDLLETLAKFCRLYDDLDLPTLKDRLLKLNTVDTETAIQNLIINNLESDARFIDESIFKRAMKATEKPYPKINKVLETIGQNYFEYNQMEIRIARFVMSLVRTKAESEKNMMFAKMHQEVKMRTDNFYKDVNRIVMEALRQTYTPMAQTYSQMGVNPHQAQGHSAGPQPNHQQPSPYGGSQMNGHQAPSFGQNPGPAYQSQFNGSQSQFGGAGAQPYNQSYGPGPAQDPARGNSQHHPSNHPMPKP